MASEIHTPGHGKRALKKRLLTALGYFGFLSLALLFDRPSFLTNIIGSLNQGGCSASEDSPLELAPPAYNLLANAKTHVGDPHTRIITIQEGSEPEDIIHNVCRQRLFLARLVQRLEAMGATSIVIDKYFLAHTCDNYSSGPGNGTDELERTFASAHIPITYGLHTDDLQGPAADSRAIKTCLVGSESIPFPGNGNCKGGCIHAGELRLNSDTRRVPLQWQVFPSQRDATENNDPDTKSSLAVVAASQANPGFALSGPVSSLLNAGSPDPPHPFTSFISPEFIPTYSARQVLCGVGFPPNAASDWDKTCAPPRPTTAQEQQTEPFEKTGALTDADIYNGIKGHIALVGEISDSDMHASVIGESVPGLVLQANYIESLLDGRVFVAVRDWISIVCYLVWFEITYLLFWKLSSPERALLLSALLLLAIVCCSYLLIWKYAYFLPVYLEGGVSVGILLLRWLECRGHKFSEEH